MAGGRLPAEVVEFARYLRALTGRLDPAKGWYAVFAQRDPEGVRACLDGREVPPWDLVQALLQDLSAQRGPHTAQEAAARAADLYRASVTAHDTTVGGPAALRDRLQAMLREQRQAARRERELHAAVRAATAQDDAEARERLSSDLAWARDDRRRATARCEELRARLAALAASPASPPGPRGARAGLAVPEGWFRDEAPETGGARGGAGTRPDGALRQAEPGTARLPRPTGARFAGAAVGPPGEAVGAPGGERATAWGSGGEPVASPGAAGPPATPRGARFAGAYEGESGARRRGRSKAREEEAGREAAGGVEARRGAARETTGSGEARRGGETAGGAEARRGAASEAAGSDEARRGAVEAVGRLARLRAEGRGGEAHVLLCEAAARPAHWLPLLAAELERAGLAADVATLLWEAACLPPPALAAAARALTVAGRGDDGARLLRQSVARPVTEVARTALALLAVGGRAEAAFLLEALVRARRPDEAARVAADAPAELVPLLLDAARGVSSSSHHDLAHALRVAGLPGAPDPA
ncbi:hypothetical protein ACI2L4_20980 [Streptomyces sparsogenes]|uniref:hypothetical protein n=1 Tax=Streptomyces sparsogenes TaxID=67365 RepID=UPI0033CCB11D